MTGGSLHVIAVDPRGDTRWMSFIDAHPDALVYHHPSWLEVLSAVYDHEPLALACIDAGGSFHGVLPLFKVRRRRATSLVSLPHTPSAGPLALTAQASARLLEDALQRAARIGGRLQVRSPSPELDKLVEGLVGTNWATTFSRALPTDPNKLRFGNSRTHGAVMRAIRKASNSGVLIRAAESEQQLLSWYQLYLATMRAHIIPPIPLRFFLAIWRFMCPLGLARLLLAEKREGTGTRLLAGSLYFTYGHTVLYSFNGRRNESLSLRPNDALHWQAMHDAIADGFSRYDMGEVDPSNVGLTRYKLKWGMETKPLFRYSYPTIMKLNPLLTEGTANRLVGIAWHRLPLSVTRKIGEQLYR